MSRWPDLACTLFCYLSYSLCCGRLERCSVCRVDGSKFLGCSLFVWLMNHDGAHEGVAKTSQTVSMSGRAVTSGDFGGREGTEGDCPFRIQLDTATRDLVTLFWKLERRFLRIILAIP